MSSTLPQTTPGRRSPMFFCYECNSEMRPLMVPDPHCSNCNSTFVEELPSDASDPSNVDDPRNFIVDPPDHDYAGPFDGPPGFHTGDPIVHIMDMLMGGMLPMPPPRRQGTTIRFNMNDGRGRVVFTSGGSPGPSFLPEGQGGSPRGAGSPRLDGPPIHPLEGLLAMLAGRPLGQPGAAGGQYGDYVLDQHSLDEIITRLMEQSQGARPVPAPDDMIAKLPRTKVTAGSFLLEKECAVCKDTFGASDDVVTLPCNTNPKYQHSFHEDCIVPWLKQNGTCPVCRYQLVPQPEHHGSPPTSPDGRNPGDSPSSGPSTSGGTPSGFTTFFRTFGRSGNSNTQSSTSSQPGGESSQSQQNSRNPPGGWFD